MSTSPPKQSFAKDERTSGAGKAKRPVPSSDRWTRRGLLKLSLGGGVLASLLAVGVGLQRTQEVRPARPLLFFTPREFSICVAAVDALLPGSGRIGSASEVSAGIDEFLASCDPASVGDLKKVLLLLENALTGFFSGGSPSPFSQLDRQARRGVLSRWRDHRWALFRTGYLAIKRLALTVYYADDRTWSSLGYPGPPDLGSFEGAPEPLLALGGRSSSTPRQSAD